MMSASKGAEGLWKSRQSKGGCVNKFSINQFQKRTSGRGVKKSEYFADIIHGCSPTRRTGWNGEELRRDSFSYLCVLPRRAVAGP